MLSRDASHPGVFGELGHVVGVCDTGLDESLGGLAPLIKIVRKETGDEFDNPGVGNFSVHAPPGESSRDHDTGDGVRAVVTQNVSGDDGYSVGSDAEIRWREGNTRYPQCS